MAITETSIKNSSTRRFVELRSVTVPTCWEKRQQWTKVFELIAILFFLLLEQQEVNTDLENEVAGLVEVPNEDTLAISNSNGANAWFIKVNLDQALLE
ncbi:hypothetical protein VTP01DRAFT_311 [Rhizomucor pusillus]|uniref:uncharacterized protein n=1 Tax=Rhizomucor pusillus TaxID=4840 RepID=UPI00374335B9